MSCYEWERGTIKIPSKAWAGFKKDLRKAFNDLQTEAFEGAMQVYKTLMEKAKGKRNIKCDQWRKWWEEASTRSVNVGGIGRFYGTTSRQEVPHQNRIFDVLGIGHLTMEWIQREKITRPKRPMKKDFPLATGKTTTFDVGGEAGIHLHNNKSRSVTWDVPENNHAREHAREQDMAEKFFALLGRITWTRNSGGKIIGNDEYNRDAGHECEGGGGSYLVDEYGPSVKKERVGRTFW